MSIKDFLCSSDPLSEEAIVSILSHREEDILVDYKESFDPDSEKQWLGITVDVMAFSNTYGGYLVFGVKDATFELLGLHDKAVKTLTNINLVIQKLNRFISPPFTRLRAKKFIKDSKSFVILCVPESIGQTHIVTKEATFTYPSGEKKIFLRPGMIFVRRSGSNQIISSSDFEFLVNRRIDQFKKVLFDRIERVVQAPVEDYVLIVSSAAGTGDEKKIVVSDAPDAIPVKGMSFTVTPQTDEHEIASLIALSKKDPGFMPRSQELWRLYSKRHELSLTFPQLLAMAKFCLLSDVPAFFWIKGCSANELKELLLESIVSKASDIAVKATIVQTGAFLGTGFKKTLIKKLGKESERLAPRTLDKRVLNPREFFSPKLIESKKIEFKVSKTSFNGFLDEEATKLAIALSKDEGGVMDKQMVFAIDCYLYARDDKYLLSKKEAEEA